ncbi:hypothetical protein ACUOCP_43420, partial [Escherichia sp. R-CC3]
MSVAGKSNPLAISGLVVLTLIWSYSWIFMKQVTSYIGAFDFTALRCIFGALVKAGDTLDYTNASVTLTDVNITTHGDNAHA